jgi:NhaC family Na+:H+ antiporter
MKKRREATLAIAMIPIMSLIVILLISVQVLKIDVHIPILLSAMIAAAVSIFILGMSWEEVQEGMVETIKTAMGPIIILMVIGLVVGAWTQAGVVPVMIYYGMKVLSPNIFLVATLLICSIISISTGSSWGTIATIGIALMGIGLGLGIPREIIAGAIISGSYFGDKMSPLSDTTNLAPAVAGAKLFDHIKHMVYTTVPSYIVTIIVFAVIGARYSGSNVDLGQIDEISKALEATFNLNPALMLVVLVTLGAIVLKIPAIPALFGGAIIGAIVSVVAQGTSVTDAALALHYGNEYSTGVVIVDDLLNGGGMDHMMWTVSMMICAMMYGGVMEKSGMLEAIVRSILKRAKSTGSLVASTVATSFLMNVFGGEQYLAIILPGRMFKDAYEERGLAPRNLSRILEDAGTITSPLIPWNNCGVYMIATLGVAPWLYVPYCVLNWLNPLISMFYGYTGISIMKLEDDPSAPQNQKELHVSDGVAE